jgi:hypothetical protein
MKQLINAKTVLDWPNVEIEYKKPIELFIDSIYGLDINKDTLKVLWVKEVRDISNFSPIAIENSKYFDIILTYDEEILENCFNSYFMPFGSTWIEEFDFKQKVFGISNLTGNKYITYGHKLRHEIHHKQNEITVPIKFYVSKFGGPKLYGNNLILNDIKNPLFETQFHICIENSNQKNLFTEKLIDCLITKTVPIFWGAENIGDFFNVNGFFIVKNVKDIVEICNSLSNKTYQLMEPYIIENYNEALKYANLSDNFKITLTKILNNGNF